jgi:hypothetical protein
VAGLVGGAVAAAALGVGAVAGLARLLDDPRRPPALAVLVGTVTAAAVVVTAFALSRRHPMWVYRYLAVALGPLLLAVAVALARGGRVALVALATALVVAGPFPGPGPDWGKSNVRDVAARTGPGLSSGDLVVTDFGRSPVLAHYLPDGLRYAETTGPVADPRLSDQRDGMRRLEEGVPAATVGPLLDGLAVGRRVLIVCTGGSPTPDATDFVRLIVARCRDAAALASRDRRLRLDLSVPTTPGAASPVDARLYTKVGA